uniref:Uncharacterized protein n=1 Tax=Tanacetum cinerariifolium TaxID=118510 RepID=A0A6L2P8Y1_TANCI|nr:hypothetical protein [Tanacetum cinerariifolium]
MAYEEAKLGPKEYYERLQMQQNLHQQQLEMLKHMRSYGADDQSAILEKLRACDSNWRKKNLKMKHRYCQQKKSRTLFKIEHKGNSSTQTNEMWL